MGPYSLSVCMIVKDKSEYLPNAIESVKDIASEIIIINTGLNDNCRSVLHTPIMQRNPTIKIFNFLWNDNFSDARNESLKHATQDWILIFDDDYIFDEESKEKLNEYLNKDNVQLYFLKINENRLFSENTKLPSDIEIETEKDTFDESSCEYFKPLLFKNRLGIKFTENIYEEIEHSEKIFQSEVTDISIQHYIYNQEHFLENLERDNRIIDYSLKNLNDVNRITYLKAQRILNLISIYREKKEYNEISDEILELHNEITFNESKLEISSFEPFYAKSIPYMLKETKNRKNALSLLIYSLNLYHDSLNILFCLGDFLYSLGDKLLDCINVLRFILNHIESGNQKNLFYIVPKYLTDTDYVNFLLASLYFELRDYVNFEYQISSIKNLNKFIEKYNSLNTILYNPFRNKTSSIEKAFSENFVYPLSFFNFELSKNMHKFIETYCDLKTFPVYLYDSGILSLETEVSNNIISPLSHFKLGKEYLRELNYDKGLEELLISLKRSFEEDNIILQKNIFSELLLKAKEIGIDDETLCEIIQEGNLICQNFPYFWYCLGKFYLKTGNISEAIINFQIALEKEKYLKENLSFIEKEYDNRIDYLTSENYNPYYEELIIKSLNLAKEILPFTLHPSLFTKTAELYKNKEYNKALETLQKLNIESLNNYEKYVLYDYLALVYERSGDFVNAEKALCGAVCGLNDEELIIRKKMVYDKKFSKVFSITTDEFETCQMKYEWENCLKEIDKIRPSTVLEIGSYKGGTMVSLSQFCLDNALLISVDWQGNLSDYDYDPVTEEDLEKIRTRIKMNCPGQSLHILRENSHEESTKSKIKEILNGKKVDLLFIDGDHSFEGVKNDYEMYRDLLSENGLILFHDIKKASTKFKSELSIFWNQIIEVSLLWNEIISEKSTKELIYSDIQDWMGIGIVYNRKKNKKIYERFNFVSLSLINAPSMRAYDNCISLFKHCFEELGLVFNHTFNKLLPEHNNILFYPCSTSDLSNYAMDFTYTVFQTEEIAITKLEGYKKLSYIRLLKDASNVWDYSEDNIEYLNSIGLDNILYLPFGFHKKMEVLNFEKEKTIDILFYGQLKERELNILEKLNKKGFKVKILYNIFGKERNQFIEKSKIILNIHDSENSLIDDQTISFLVNNRCFVISENSKYMKNNHYRDGVIFSEYEKLAETCEFYLKQENETLRKAIAGKGYNIFSGNKMTDRLKNVLEKISNSPRPLGDPL